MKKTKIICTMGPACENEPMIREMMKTGMSVARINFSHQNQEINLMRLAMLRKVSRELSLPLAIMADTKGPEIRLGTIPNGPVELVAGQSFKLTTEMVDGDDKTCHISFKNLPNDVSKGSKILIDDGLIGLEVVSTTKTEIDCTVLNGGKISSNKGVNVPGVVLSMPYISERDREDLRFIVENNFDYIAASFVRKPEDVLAIREELKLLQAKNIKIISKIENAEGVENAEEILKVSDGIMVARGDLGVELPLEDIPAIQKNLIAKATMAGKTVITATQMLDSMMGNPRPTRAEVTDVANAIYEGTSTIMLSGETAAGKYPVESVQTMAKITESTERDIDYKARFNSYDPNPANYTVPDAISYSACAAAHNLSAAAIITVTRTGGTARMISKHHPECPIVGCSADDRVVRQLAMNWGVIPMKLEDDVCDDNIFAHAIEVVEAAKLIKKGDLVIFVAGITAGEDASTTNMMRAHVVGDPVR